MANGIAVSRSERTGHGFRTGLGARKAILIRSSRRLDPGSARFHHGDIEALHARPLHAHGQMNELPRRCIGWNPYSDTRMNPHSFITLNPSLQESFQIIAFDRSATPGHPSAASRPTDFFVYMSAISNCIVRDRQGHPRPIRPVVMNEHAACRQEHQLNQHCHPNDRNPQCLLHHHLERTSRPTP